MSPTIFFSSEVLLLDDILAPKVILYDLLKEWKHSGREYFPAYSCVAFTRELTCILLRVGHRLAASVSPGSLLEIEFQTPLQTYWMRICILTRSHVICRHIKIWEALFYNPYSGCQKELICRPVHVTESYGLRVQPPYSWFWSALFIMVDLLLKKRMCFKLIRC